MKKTYSKPEVLFEDFRLMDSISADCTNYGATPTQAEPTACKMLNTPLGNIFTTYASCEDIVDGPEVMMTSYFGS